MAIPIMEFISQLKFGARKQQVYQKLTPLQVVFKNFFVDVKQFTFVLKKNAKHIFSEHLSVVASIDFTFSNFEILFKTEKPL